MWVTFNLNQKVCPGLYWVYLYPNPRVSWCFTIGGFPGLQAAYFGAPVEAYFEDFTPTTVPRKLPTFEEKWRLEEDVSYCLKLESWPYAGQNVVNGFFRPDKGPNIWISDPNKALPQYLEIDLGDKKSFNVIYLTFDTNLDLWINGHIGPVPECVRDYNLSYWDGNSWVEILTEKGNYLRHRIHRFEPVTANRLRLTVQATNGANTARVYEIRIYREY
jgi:hypothetical protein